MNKKQYVMSDRVLLIFSYVFMALFAFICIYPLILTLSVSLSTEREVAIHGYSIFPRGFTWNTYLYIFAHSGSKILRAYGLTIFVTIVGTIGSLLITTMISFALSIRTLRYRNIIAFLCNFTIIFSAGLIPWYIVCVNYYNLRNSVLALILPPIFSVWNMFLLRTYFSAIPVSLYEAARIEGANYFKIYYKIALPLCKTGILTVGMMYALQYWNDWWNALMFINDKDLYTLQFYLYNILSNVNAIGSGRVPSGAAANIALPAETVKMAVTIITIGPVIFLYPLVQRHFISGIMVGAVKE